jgi:hypothetical protein
MPDKHLIPPCVFPRTRKPVFPRIGKLAHETAIILNKDSTAKTLPLDREAERFVAIALAPLRSSH